MKDVPYLHRLRICATVAVVLMHVTSKEFYVPTTASPEWQILNVYNGLTHWAVPVFVMISGAIFLDPEREIPIRKLFGKYILRIFIALVFWSAVYAVAYTGIYLHGSAREVFYAFLEGHVHLWYLPMLIGLYLLVPLLRRITESPFLTKYFLLLTGIFSILLPELGRWGIAPILRAEAARLDIHLCLGYSGFFVAGYALHRLEIRKSVRTALYLLAQLATLGMIAYSGTMSARSGSVQIELYEAFSLGTVLQSLGIFLAFRQFGNRKACPHLIRSLSEMTFGIYLIHEFWVDFLRRFCGISPLAFSPLIAIPVTVTLVLAGSAVSTFLLRKVEFFRKTIV